MEIREETIIDAPLSSTWPLLRDVDLIASSLPGATLTGVDEEGRHQGRLTVQFGPTQVTFQGSILFEVDEAGHQVSLSGRGRDNRGRNRASVELGVRATDLDGRRTSLDIQGDIAVVGPLESFAATGGRHLAQELLREFTRNMTTMLQGTGADDAGHPPAEPRRLSAWRLAWGAFRSWLRDLLSGHGGDR